MSGRQQYIASVSTGATDLDGIGIPGNSVRGVTIDNPTGSWLLLFPTYDFVPPYVLGWSRDIGVDAANVTIRFTDGPSGQISTQVGDPITVVLSSDPVGFSDGVPSPGAPFISNFTPVLAAYQGIYISETANPFTTATLVAAIAGKRIRLYTLTAAMEPNKDTPFSVIFSGTAGNPDFGVFAYLALSPSSPSQQIVYQPGLDVPVNDGISANPATTWGDGFVAVTATYSVV